MTRRADRCGGSLAPATQHLLDRLQLNCPSYEYYTRVFTARWRQSRPGGYATGMEHRPSGKKHRSITEEAIVVYCKMNIQQVLRWIAIAIVLIVAVAVLSVILKVGAALLSLALKVLLVLLLIAIVLRFIDVVRDRR